MTESRTRVLLVGTSEQNLNEYLKKHAKELCDFHVKIAEKSENAVSEISKVKIVVFVLSNASLEHMGNHSEGVSEASEALDEREISLIRCLSASKSTHLRWIFVGAPDFSAFQALCDLVQSENIVRWRYLKTPLLEKELSIEIKSQLEEEFSTEQLRLDRNFKDSRMIIGELAHEFANLILRVMSRAELALAAADAEQAPPFKDHLIKDHLKKLLQATDAAVKFTRDLQKQPQDKIQHSTERISNCVQQAVHSVQAIAENKKISFALNLYLDEPMALDPLFISESMQGLLGFLIEAVPAGAEIAISSRPEFKSGQPGMLVSFSSVGEAVSESISKRALQYGRDLRLPTAKKMIEAHGGFLEYPPGSSPRVLIWLPARLYAKTV